MLLKAIVRAAEKLGTETRERHGVALTMYIGTTPLDTRELWPKLEAAMDLIAQHSPVWLRRMRMMDNSVNVRRIPGNRARLIQQRLTILDPYLLANFAPAQIASSIVHEATHAMMRYHDIKYDPAAPAREERACRRSELRLGKKLDAAGVPAASDVVNRAASALTMKDEEVGVVVNWQDMKTLETVTLINELPVPKWMKRLIARRRGVLDTPQGKSVFRD